jgi:hypothetical protein
MFGQQTSQDCGILDPHCCALCEIRCHGVSCITYQAHPAGIMNPVWHIFMREELRTLAGEIASWVTCTYPPFQHFSYMFQYPHDSGSNQQAVIKFYHPTHLGSHSENLFLTSAMFPGLWLMPSGI